MMLNKFIGGPVIDQKIRKVYMVDPFEKFVCNFSCRYCIFGTPLADTCPLSQDRFSRVSRDIGRFVLKRGVRGINAFLVSPMGEPTLYPELPQLIRILKSFGKPVAIYTNSAGLLDDTVYNLLLNFDIVLFKLDSVYRDTMEDLNKPNMDIDPEKVVKRLIEFRRDYGRKMYLETVFVGGYNDSLDEAMELARVVKIVNPNKYFMVTPYLPPGRGVRPPDINVLRMVYRDLSSYMPNRVYIIDQPGERLLDRKSDDPIEELIYVVNLYPLTLRAAVEYLEENGLPGMETIRELEELGDVRIVEWMGESYVVANTVSRMIKSG